MGASMRAFGTLCSRSYSTRYGVRDGRGELGDESCGKRERERERGARRDGGILLRRKRDAGRDAERETQKERRRKRETGR